MGIWTRLSDLIAANVNGLLDRAENPELMLRQLIRDMEEALVTARRHGAAAIAAERRLSRELQHHRDGATYWKAKAAQALAAGRDDLARRALVRKKEHDDLANALDLHHAKARRTSETVRLAIHALQARTAEAQRKQRALIARQRAAQAHVLVQRFTTTGVADFGTAQAQFQALEDRIEQFEEEVAAAEELGTRDADLTTGLAALERSQAVDEELEAVRREQAGREGE